MCDLVIRILKEVTRSPKDLSLPANLQPCPFFARLKTLTSINPFIMLPALSKKSLDTFKIHVSRWRTVDDG